MTKNDISVLLSLITIIFSMSIFSEGNLALFLFLSGKTFASVLAYQECNKRNLGPKWYSASIFSGTITLFVILILEDMKNRG